MPPSKLACQALATAYKLKGEIADKLSDIGSAVLKIITLRAQSKFGIVDIADAIGAEVIAAIGSIASRVAESTLGSISKMGAAVMENVFGLLLKILLAFPTAIFSLVAIPHDAAVRSTKREGIYLRRAEKNLNSILYIILKWTRGKSGTDYYNQMVEALPFITTAINLCKDLIHGLEGEPTRPGEFGNNSVFKEGIYNKIKANLNTAINISKPISLIDQRTQISKRLEADKNKRYQLKADAINEEYGRRRKAESDRYRDQVANSTPEENDPVPDRLEDAVKLQKIGLVYNQRLENLKTWKTEQLELANLEAESEALVNKDTWIGAIADTGSQFVDDMRVLGDELLDMLNNIKDAYVQNKESQLYCNNIYDMRNIIIGIVKEMISYLRSTGNAAGKVLAAAISESQSLMEVAEQTYTVATDPGFDYSASELSRSLSIGHGTLLAADAVLDSVVTDKLIELINADDVLQAENDEFDEFIEKLALIPDWNGKTGVWSVDILNSSISPYIQLIADLTEMTAKVPILSVRNRESDRRRVQSLIKGVKKDFAVLRRHNSFVANTLSSYTPYIGSEAGDLMKILASSGLLKNFATAMSITSLVTDIVSNFSDNFGDEFPNYENCTASDAYPELFVNPAILKGMTNNNLNMQDPKLQNQTQAKWENNNNDKKVPEIRDELKHTDYTKLDNNDETQVLGYPGQDGSSPNE